MAFAENIKNQFQSEDIVISGVGGRYPRSDSIDEFADNLYNAVDMITDDKDCERWPNDLYGMCPRMGKIKNIDKFDGHYFGILAHVADAIDPQSRILLETTFEAIVDAGYTPQQLRGSKTGVYIGLTTIGMPDGIPQDIQRDSSQAILDASVWMTASAKMMYSNRISFAFDFHGPSYIVDTGCSSSIFALDSALSDLRTGKCDQAIVGGTQINLQPFTNCIYQGFTLNANDGMSKVWDKDADGFVRGETIACLFLQKKSEAKRIYATVLHSKTNTDGYKKSGSLFPSRESQLDLMVSTYREAGVNPRDINYIEAHATGTKAGDSEEANAIYNAFKDNDEVYVGLLKSSIGHAEGASGIAAVSKAIISLENQCLATNLNIKELKPDIAALCPPLIPVRKNTKFRPKVTGVNSFGIGGANGHVLLKGNDKELNEDSYKIANDLPRLVNVCGRTKEAVDHLFDFIQNNPSKVTREFLAILNESAKFKIEQNTAGLPYRGSMLIKEKNDGECEYTRECTENHQAGKEIWFFFSGMGSQWVGMAKDMMKIKTFSDTIHKCADIMSRFRVDLLRIILSDEENALESVINPFVAITSIQIALCDVLTELGIQPDKIIGHSFGEIACAYADGCLTLEQTLLCSYWRGKVVEDGTLPAGVMAAVGLGCAEVKRRLPPNVFVACDNTPDSVTISGLENDAKQFIEKLNSENVFVRRVAGFNLKPYHSKFMSPIADVLTKILRNVMPEPKQRSSKWISTSVLESQANDEALKFASPEYFVNNLMTPVLFTSGLKQAPEDVIMIEIAPHALFANLIKRSLKSVNYIGLMKRNNTVDNAEMFLSSMGKLYQLGLNVAIENLYPKVEWPVPRGTQSLSSLVKWDHSVSYFVKKWPEFHFQSTASDLTNRFDLNKPEHNYLRDHCIDGRVIFPGTGYLMLAWRRLASSRGQPWYTFPVVFENVQFRRTVTFEGGKLKLTVRYLDPTGNFVILDSGNVAATGKISIPEDSDALKLQHLINDPVEEDETTLELDEEEFYREARVRGYDYGPHFQGITGVKIFNKNLTETKVKWSSTTSFMVFLDTVLQAMITASAVRLMFIPAAISSLRCDPRIFFTSVKESQQEALVKIANNSELNTDYLIGENTARKEIENFSTAPEKAEREHRKEYTLVPVRHYVDIRLIIAKGIEISGMQPVNMPRRAANNGLRLEKYQFVPYFEEKVTDATFQNELTSYLDVCNSLCSKLKDQLKFDPQDFDQFTPVTESVLKKMTTDIADEHVMLKLLNDLREAFDTNNNADKDKLEELNKKITDNDPEYDLTKDLVNLPGRNERLIRPLIDLVNENSSGNKELRVAEINLGQGIIQNDIKNHLVETFIAPTTIDYTVINDQPDLLSCGDDIKLQKWTGESGYPQDLAQRDLIIHKDTDKLWHLDLSQYLEATANAIKQNGFLLAVFKTDLTGAEKVLTKLRNSPVPSRDKLKARISAFESSAVDSGLTVISKKSDGQLFEIILFRKTNKNPTADGQAVVPVNTGNYEQWLEQLKETIREYKDHSEEYKIWLLADDSEVNGICGLTNCLRMEAGGERIRYIFDGQNQLPKPVDFTAKPYSELLAKDLVSNVYRDGQFGAMKHINLPKYDEKVETPHAYFNVLHRGDLNSLQWFDGRNIHIPSLVGAEIRNIVKDIDVDVYTSALNFRDVMMSTGRISAGPEGALMDCLIGSEFAGRRCDTGERVFGFTFGSGIATYVKTNDAVTFKVPDHWSMEDAATVSNVYMTVWYGLLERGRLSEGDTILIHSASGGIGQSALNVCQYYKCKIFVTVGTEDKRQYLKTHYGLKDEQIFNSRTTEFEEKVMQATNGRGVDLVLNSLAEDKLLASFRCMAQDGRFIEIGKYDFLQNNPLPMFAFLKNVAFHGIMLDKMFLLSTRYQYNMFRKFNDWFEDGVKKGYIKPLMKTIFEVENVKEAFKHMMTGKHMGKILIRIRDEEHDPRPMKASAIKVWATPKTWFLSEKVYIIIGGLGGMGLELAYWMSMRGAKKFVLTSRSGIKSDSQKMFLSNLKDFLLLKGENLVLKICREDATDLDDAKKIIATAEELGQIGGIFQLAVVLHDALIDNQTVDTYEMVCQAKVDVTINLDKVTRQMRYPLDYFVAFSSITCGRGNNGQSPYGYSNSVMERVCENRRRDGLHGLAIQWGPIGDIGVLVSTMDADKLKMASGLTMQRVPSWIGVFDRFLQCPHPVLASTIRAEREVKGRSLEENVVSQLWSAMGVDPKAVSNDATLEELGIESFVIVELQQKMEKDFDINLSINNLKKITVAEIKEFQNGNREYIKSLSTSIKVIKSHISKMKLVIPTEPFTKLNQVTDGKPIYFLPPLEGLFENLLPLAQALPYPVYGINWTPNFDEFGSIEDVSLHYLTMLSKLNHNYNVVGFSFGSALAVQLCYERAEFDNIFIIDSFSGQDNEEFNEEDIADPIFKSLFTSFPKIITTRIKKELGKVKSMDEKMKKLLDTLKEYGAGSNAKDLEKIILGTIARAKMLIKYRDHIKNFSNSQLQKSMFRFSDRYLMTKLNGKVVVIKSTLNPEDKEQLVKELEEFGINRELTDGKYQLEPVLGTSDEILSVNLEKTVDIIKSCIDN